MVIFWGKNRTEFDLPKVKLHIRTDDNTHMFAPSPKVYILLRVNGMVFILEAQPTDQIYCKKIFVASQNS